MNRAKKILNETFGYSDFRNHQADIVATILDGKDALVLMPTGGGKSLCYQIPSIVRPGVGVVISPLIALMEDQVSALQLLGVEAAYINSTLSAAEVKAIEDKAVSGKLDMLYLSPERLANDDMLAFLKTIKLALFAIDEAHCVSQWGHDFRPDYQQLSVLSQEFPDVPRIALTATADERVRDEIANELNLQDAQLFVSSFDRPNIRYAIEEQDRGKQQLWEFISQNHAEDAGIVYCLSRRKVESVADYLTGQGRTALPYHAGLSARVRAKHQKRFLMEEGVIIVATIAFGMGIDKPDVRFVAHFSMPKNIESYYQETGRAGRDGQPANAWMAYNYKDVVMQRQFIRDSEAGDEYKNVLHNKLDALVDLCEQLECRRITLLRYFGEELAEPCGNCDNCLNPPEKIDASTEAQMALSAIYRTDQRFGIMYLIDVITGNKSEPRIAEFKHDKLKLFGLGKNHPKTWWRRLYRQLISLGYVEVDDQFGALKLNEKAKPILKGDESFYLRDVVKAKNKTTQNDKLELGRHDTILWNALRKLRTDLAAEHGVPPYVIFSDASLLEMIRKRPVEGEKFMYISGVGEYKLAKYGEAFLKVIKDNPLPEKLDNRLDDEVNVSLDHFLELKSVDAVAKKLDLNTKTVYAHLAQAIAAGLVDRKEVTELDDNEIDYIEETAEMTGYMEDKKLKPVFDALDGLYDYGVLRCVLAELE
ncbi:DNA helicase RecQ [Marinicella sp. S6413]|uniref:DNA helicase RecQ n=1 Tax=Marinicella gelatinilytica TaxID=2996017 RepID=UPI002260BBD4|nr:DNA helicase RecQ [Marinicella gelatinilytica]MCX7545475.1 DNA helicase RecQ [Marinicella gelatinilytica]